MIDVITHNVGILRTNCYLIKDVSSQIGAIVDPGGISDPLIKILPALKEVKYILLTHGHFDHILKALEYKKLTGAKITIGINESEFTENNLLNLSYKFHKRNFENFKSDILVKEGEELKLGESTLKIIDTPGHTKGSVCYLIGGCIFSGDTLLRGDCGRSDFISGDAAELKKSLIKLYGFEKDYIIYPGHGKPTTLFEEKNNKTGL